MYGGSLGLQTTVNIGVKDLKPRVVVRNIITVELDLKKHLPPIGSFGLPVVNCKKSRR